MTDDLAKEVERFKEQTAARSRARYMDAKYSRTARMREDVKSTGRFVRQFMAGVQVLREWVFGPIFWLLVDAAKWIWRQYRKLWSLVVHKRTEDDVLVASKFRAAGMILATLAFLWWVTLPILECVFIEAPMFALTARVNEEVFLSGSQELNPYTSQHAIKGCKELPCDEHDAIYYRTDNSLFNNIWSLINTGDLFWPEYVAAVVPAAWSRCTITSYYFRFRVSQRYLNIFPSLLSAKCGAVVQEQDHSVPPK